MLKILENYGITTETIVLIIFLIILFVTIFVNKKYILDSIRELKHVVWPTRAETTNYFVVVVIVLVLF
jgi:hypothetical protein